MSITKNKKISRNPEARYLLAEVLDKLITKIHIDSHPQNITELAEYLLAELEDAGITGIVWSERDGGFKSGKSKHDK